MVAYIYSYRIEKFAYVLEAEAEMHYTHFYSGNHGKSSIAWNLPYPLAYWIEDIIQVVVVVGCGRPRPDVHNAL